MADGTVKVVIAFDRDPAKIGKTVEVPRDQARVMLAEGRARLAGKTKLSSGAPTVTPPMPEVVASPVAPEPGAAAP